MDPKIAPNSVLTLCGLLRVCQIGSVDGQAVAGLINRPHSLVYAGSVRHSLAFAGLLLMIRGGIRVVLKGGVL